MTTAHLSRPMEVAGQWVRRLLAWWLGELAALLPMGLVSRSWNSDHSPAELEVGASDLSLLIWRRGTVLPARVPLTGQDETARRQRVATALRQARLGPAATIRLDPSLLLSASVTMPIAAEANLRDVLRLRMDELVPLPPTEVCFEYWIAPRMPADRMITVHLVIATRTSLDHALSLARAVGLDPRQVVAVTDRQGNGEGTGRRIVLLRVGSSWDDHGTRRHLPRGLEGLAAALVVLTYVVWVHRLDVARDAVAREVATLGQTVAETRAIAQRVSRSREELAIPRHRQQEPGPLQVLNEVTALLPDHVWITRLSHRDTAVEISGVAPRATDLIALIDASALFERPHFRAPTTLSADGRGERFEIGFSVRTAAR